MKEYLFILNILFTISIINATYQGPFLLWGPIELQQENQSALEEFNHKSLTLLYSEAKAIILFVRNGTNKLDKNDYPKFHKFISESAWIYFPLENLPAEPMDYNSNVEVITLVGPASQQDIELGALFRDAVSIYGENKVLGILSNQGDDQHFIYKREAVDEGNEETKDTTDTKDTKDTKEIKKGKKDKSNKKPSKSNKKTKEDEEEPQKEETEEEVEEEEEEEEGKDNFIYLADKKGLLYINNAPILNLTSEGKVKSFTLTTHGSVTHDLNSKRASLDINFKTEDGKITLRFRFPLSQGYWTLSSVQVEFGDLQNIILPIVNPTPPSAPIEFSYKCGQGELLFKNGSNSLTIKDFQVQPILKGVNRFSDAYDCVGFMSAPIISGLFVATITLTNAFIGIAAIWDIKKPNFENSRSKPLSFTVQE